MGSTDRGRSEERRKEGDNRGEIRRRKRAKE